MLINPNLKYYLNDGPTKGIIRIYNLRNDKSHLVISENIIEDSKKIRFQLDLGFYGNKELQKDYSEIGLELFSIEPILYIEDEESLEALFEKAKAQLLSNNIDLY